MSYRDAAGRGIMPVIPVNGNKDGVAAPFVITSRQPFVAVTATPLLDTSAYSIGDSLHITPMTFGECFDDTMSGYVEKMLVFDSLVQSSGCSSLPSRELPRTQRTASATPIS
jgi:hypothetical protein